MGLVPDRRLRPRPGVPIGPYAQMSRYPQGFYCEAVGESYLPADQWELDPAALHADGWNPPDPTTDNWWYIADTG